GDARMCAAAIPVPSRVTAGLCCTLTSDCDIDGGRTETDSDCGLAGWGRAGGGEARCGGEALLTQLSCGVGISAGSGGGGW
ncbi:MAG: hypothetical protein ACPIOQ_69075, partial [Promethearchaeia archaeon]